MGIRPDRFCDVIGYTLIVSAAALMAATLLAVDPVGTALCGVDGPPAFDALSLVPVYFSMLLAGIGSAAKPYVRQLLRAGFSQRDLKRILLGLVVSGGSVYKKDGKYCLRYYGKDAAMHAVFGDLAYQIYGTRPQTVRIESRGTCMSQLYSKAAVLEIGEFSPELASRKGETPTISYILEGEGRVRVEAARVVMSNSGWVTCTFSVVSGSTRAYPRLGFGSVLGGNLAKEYLELMGSVPLRMDSFKNTKYPGKGYLATTDCAEMQSFLRAGGFLKGATVKKGTFSGVEKNRLLRAMVGATGMEYESKASAVDSLANGCDEATLELNMYLERLRLG